MESKKAGRLACIVGRLLNQGKLEAAFEGETELKNQLMALADEDRDVWSDELRSATEEEVVKRMQNRVVDLVRNNMDGKLKDLIEQLIEHQPDFALKALLHDDEAIQENVLEELRNQV